MTRPLKPNRLAVHCSLSFFFFFFSERDGEEREESLASESTDIDISLLVSATLYDRALRPERLTATGEAKVEHRRGFSTSFWLSIRRFSFCLRICIGGLGAGTVCSSSLEILESERLVGGENLRRNSSKCTFKAQ